MLLESLRLSGPNRSPGAAPRCPEGRHSPPELRIEGAVYQQLVEAAECGIGLSPSGWPQLVPLTGQHEQSGRISGSQWQYQMLPPAAFRRPARGMARGAP